MSPFALASGSSALAALLLLLAAGPAAAPLPAQASRLDLGAPGRPAEEVARDATSKPLAVFEFFEIGPGDVVADLMAGGGYNTAILTHVVGEEGAVFSQDGRLKAVSERKERGDLKDRANVVVFEKVEELPPDSLDAALTVRNYHDLPPEGIPAWLAAVRRALKPGAVFGVVDVRTRPGFRGRAEDLHRISEDLVVEEVTAAGFEFVGASDLLANPADAYESSEFGNREATDRMVLKFRKPAADEPARRAAPGAGA
jgi:predicted methyltransferase